jgi:hypothetical protein
LAFLVQDKPGSTSGPPKPGALPDKTAGTPSPAPTPPATPPAPSPAAEEALAAGTQAPGLTDQAQAPATRPLTLLGDQGTGLGIPAIAFGRPGNPLFPPLPGQFLPKTATAAVIIPSLRGFKITEDEAPGPQDRVYVTFNYFNRVNEDVNRRFGGDIHNVMVYRETFGAEKTFLDGDFSLGLRVPLNSIDAESALPGVGGSSTDIGDLTFILKYALWRDRKTGDLFSVGLAVTAPTGPDSFGNLETFRAFHNTILQPFVGYRWSSGDFFIHGFTALGTPTDTNDVTILFNDVGIGYFFRHGQEQNPFISAVVPTFELHVNTPLNHRGALNPEDIAGAPDIVNLTTGVTFEMRQQAELAVGLVTPVTGPKPFDFEVLVQFNWRFGAGARRTTPALGG